MEVGVFRFSGMNWASKRFLGYEIVHKNVNVVSTDHALDFRMIQNQLVAKIADQK